jgi:hypothetical protein
MRVGDLQTLEASPESGVAGRRLEKPRDFLSAAKFVEPKLL